MRLIFKKRLKVAVSAMLISAVLAGCGNTVENTEGSADTHPARF